MWRVYSIFIHGTLTQVHVGTVLERQLQAHSLCLYSIPWNFLYGNYTCAVVRWSEHRPCPQEGRDEGISHAGERQPVRAT